MKVRFSPSLFNLFNKSSSQPYDSRNQSNSHTHPRTTTIHVPSIKCIGSLSSSVRNTRTRLDKDAETLNGSTVGELLLDTEGVVLGGGIAVAVAVAISIAVLVARCRCACVGYHCEGARAEKVVDI
jgi:hypothetical protein